VLPVYEKLPNRPMFSFLELDMSVSMLSTFLLGIVGIFDLKSV
jgi:hypothetical protein